MDSGRGNADVPLVCKYLAVILCTMAVCININLEGIELVSNRIVFDAGGYIIVVGIFLGWSIVKGDVEKLFAAWMMTCGAISNILAGVDLMMYYIGYKNSIGDMQLIGGCLVLAGGVVMLIDALHNFEVF